MRTFACVALAAAALLLHSPAAVRAADATRDDVEKALVDQHLHAWFPRCLDREHGGFLCDFNYEWQAAGEQPKTVVYQSRMTWLASRAAERYGRDDPRYLEAARHGFAHLQNVQWDKDRGGWYWKLDRAGHPTSAWRDAKHAYGVSFGIYACAAYYRATKDPKGLDLAKEAFAWLEKHGHDRKGLGYFEFFAADGTPILTDDANPFSKANNGRDCIGTRVGYKSMNTHIHLLEAFTELYGVWPDALLKERTAELLAIIRDKVVAPPGAMHQFFNTDWTPVPDVDSFGHDVETAYLLIEAAEALGMKDGPEMARTLKTAKSLLDHALDYSWDDKAGGFRETGGTFGPVHDNTKVWWSQAEGLNALLLMSRKFPDDPRGYRKLFDRQWA